MKLVTEIIYDNHYFNLLLINKFGLVVLGSARPERPDGYNE